MAVVSVRGDGKLESDLLDGSGGRVHEVEGVAVRITLVCGAEGVPSDQPCVVEDGYGFVVCIVQTLTKGTPRVEQLTA